MRPQADLQIGAGLNIGFGFWYVKASKTAHGSAQKKTPPQGAVFMLCD